MSKRILWITLSAIAILLISLASAPLVQTADNVTFWVLDSNGNPLDGVNVSYNDYSNHWEPLGTTVNGEVTATLADGTYNIKAVKDYSQQVESVVVSSTGSQIFQTDEFTVHVEDSTTANFEGIAVTYNDYSNHYLSMGNTDINGLASIELFPGTYTFRVTKDHSTATGTGDSNSYIEFQTTPFTVHVKDSSGANFEGIAVAYNDYSNHYISMGNTDVDGLASIELFPGTYTFRATKDHSAVTGATSSNIEFQTALFTVHVKDSSGADFPGIAASYNDYSNHYLSMGATDANGEAFIELFPGTYTFQASKDHTSATGDTSGYIDFQTAEAIGIVKDCDGTPLEGFKVAFNDYSNHWFNMGTTGVDGKASIELFPGLRNIRASIDYTHEDKDLDLTLTKSTVEFNPTKVNFTYSGSVKYNDYSNHWKTMTSPFYLFPGTYTFMFDDVQQDITIGGCSLTGSVLTLVDEVGAPLANYPADYPTEVRNLKYKYRCGGSWGPETSFQTDANGQIFYSIGCSNWDNKITVTLNQTSLEQDVTVNPVFQAAKVNANLKSCTGDPITDVPGGAVDQGGGFWYHHDNTGPTGTVTFYTFPGNIKLRMGYNYNSEERSSIAINAGTNEVDFQTGSIDFGSQTAHWAHGSHYYFTGLVQLLPGDYHMDIDGVGFDFTITAGVCGITPPIGDTNQDPELDVDQFSVSVDEGQTASNSGSVSDQDGDDVALSTSVGTVTNNGNGTWSWSFGTNDGPVQSQTVTIYGDDGNGGTAETSFQLTVNNVAPSVDSISIPLDPVDINNQPISASASFSDPAGTYDESYACTVDYGDGVGDQTGTVIGTTCTGPDQVYTEPGVYQVTVSVTDKDGGIGNATTTDFIVVYDPNGGFVTGGGWIMSPAGAYKADETLTGKATFGFVAKYKKGANVPDGNTEFQFKAGDLNFHSTNYDWLVVAGDKAQFKGEGTINGQGSYKFMISADDDSPDTFRIQIWGDAGTVYDNGSQQSLGKGSIVVHQ